LNDLAKLQKEEQELLIKTYGNRMEQAMNRGDREAAQIYMYAMYETIRVRNAALMQDQLTDAL
jgi:hypothetical protein